MMTNVTYWLDYTTECYPEKAGIIDPDERIKTSLNFTEIRYYAMQIAEQFIDRGIFKQPVAIYMDKSAFELVSFFGVAYSGNFYSPIDIDMPVSRIRTILDTFAPVAVITRREYYDDVKGFAGEASIICIEDVLDIRKYEIHDKAMDPVVEKVQNSRKRCCDTDLLYVLFTSGSTGIPKGVAVCHQSVIDYIDWVVKTFEIGSATTFGNQAPFYFDNSILDIYSMMRTGAALNIIPHNLFSWPVKLLEYIRDNYINAIFWVPSAMINVSKLHAFQKIDLRDRLHTILFCGEVMPNKHLNVWRKAIPDATYANLYGPTEITDVCAYYRIDREFKDDEPLPIGRALPNCECMILDGDHIVNDGGTGELCIRGSCLAKGYYGNRDRTDEAFVQNPLQDKYEEKIYRTGDLVRKNEYGEMIYVGRIDNQIKHSGHRIELGEIETALSAVDGISNCCCLHDESRDHIVAFIDADIDKKTINVQLKSRLPEYMLPNKVITIKQMPLNPNGKIDRKELKKYL